MIPLLQAHLLSLWLIRALGSISECQPGPPGQCEISPYFGVDTHRYTLVLQFRNVLVLSTTTVQVPCLYVAQVLRYSCFSQFVPVKAVHDSNDSISGDF